MNNLAAEIRPQASVATLVLLLNASSTSLFLKLGGFLWPQPFSLQSQFAVRTQTPESSNAASYYCIFIKYFASH